MRKRIRNAPFTDRALQSTLADLAKLKEWGIDPNERLERGMQKGWRGVLFDSDKPAPVLVQQVKPKTTYEIERDEQLAERRSAIQGMN